MILSVLTTEVQGDHMPYARAYGHLHYEDSKYSVAHYINKKYAVITNN